MGPEMLKSPVLMLFLFRDRRRSQNTRPMIPVPTIATVIPMPALAPAESPATSSSSSSSFVAELLALAADAVVDEELRDCVLAEVVVEEVALVEDSTVAWGADDGAGRLLVEDEDVVGGAAPAGTGVDVVVTVASVAVAQRADTKLVAWVTMFGGQACLTQSRMPKAKSGLAHMQLASPPLQPREPPVPRTLSKQVFWKSRLDTRFRLCRDIHLRRRGQEPRCPAHLQWQRPKPAPTSE